MWPLEGFHPAIRFITYFTPLTLPYKATTDIIIKDFGLTHPSVFKGFVVLVAWSFILMFLCFKVVKKRKYTRNT
jgi:ABC-type uncharacterized transport system permease subunit